MFLLPLVTGYTVVFAMSCLSAQQFDPLHLDQNPSSSHAYAHAHTCARAVAAVLQLKLVTIYINKTTKARAERQEMQFAPA